MKTYFIIPINGEAIAERGLELFSEQIEKSIPIEVPDYAVAEIMNKSYVIYPIPIHRLEIITNVPDKEHTTITIFQNAQGDIIRKSLSGKIIEYSGNWKVGDRTQYGVIKELGDQYAAVEGETVKTISKSLLRRVTRKPTDIELMEAGQYKSQLIKSLTGLAPNAVQKEQSTGLAWHRKGGQKLQHKYLERKPNPHDPDGYIYLYELPNGDKQWKDDQGNPIKLNAKAKAKEPRLTYEQGDTVDYEGHTGEVIQSAPNVIAIKSEGGKIVVKKTSDVQQAKKPPAIENDQKVKYKGESHTISVKGGEHSLLRNDRTGITTMVRNSDIADDTSTERKFEKWTNQTAELKPSGEREKQIAALSNKMQNQQHYIDWRGELEHQKGWKFESDFKASKEIEWGGAKRKISHFYDENTRKVYGLIDDREVILNFNGTNHNLLDIDPETGDMLFKDNLDNFTRRNAGDLDQYKGTLFMDKDGAIHIMTGERERGTLIKSPEISQQDLLNAETIKIINDTVWGRVSTTGSTAIGRDLQLGKIDRGVVAYHDGVKIAIVNRDMDLNVFNKSEIARDIDESDIDPAERKLKVVFKQLGEKQKERAHQRADLNIVKARIEQSNAVPAGERLQPRNINIDKSNYADNFKSYISGLGTGVEDRIYNSYNTPEWNANVKTLAEQFRAHDIQKNEEAVATNAISKGGMKIEIPEVPPVDEYLDVADQHLRDYRREVSNKLKTERMKTQQGTKQTTIDREELGEIPTNAKVISEKPARVRDQKGDVYFVNYAIVPMNSIIASHDVEGNENAMHPSELQARKRTSLQSKQQMKRISQNIDTNLVETSPDATSGAPIIYSKGGKNYVSQGNGRAAGIKGSEGEHRQKYYSMMMEQAQKLGLNTEGIQPDDMLVRVLSPRHNYQDALSLAAYGQESNALPPTEVEKARAFQNVSGSPISNIKDMNLSDIGGKPITSENVDTFIRNNPVLYKEMIKRGGYNEQDVQGHPDLQANFVNTALLAQLSPEFIEEVAGSSDQNLHSFVKRIAPTLASNQIAIADGRTSKDADLQKFLHNTMKMYDSLDSGTKNSLTIKNGASDFLTDDYNNAPDTALVRKMRQEDLMGESGKENRSDFRDPLKVIGLIAYHNAVNSKAGDEVNAQRRLQTFALKMRRFADALESENQDQGDIFGATKSEEEKNKDAKEKLIKIAERTLLENRAFKEESLTAEDQELAKESLGKFDIIKRMSKMAKEYGIPFEYGSESILQKSLKLFGLRKLQPNNTVQTIAVDFDGVIHGYSEGYKDGSIYDKPIAGAFQNLEKLIDKGFKVVIYTTRENHEDIKKWFKKEEWTREVPEITNKKPLALAYIDDRAIHFNSWNKAMAEVDKLNTAEMKKLSKSSRIRYSLVQELREYAKPIPGKTIKFFGKAIHQTNAFSPIMGSGQTSKTVNALNIKTTKPTIKIEDGKTYILTGKKDYSKRRWILADDPSQQNLFSNEPAGTNESKYITETENLKKWFGDSKVIDKDGKPLILFHGTAENFNEFDANKGGINLGDKETGSPIWFCKSPEAASIFTMLSKMNKPESKKRLQEIDTEYNKLNSEFHANYGKEPLRQTLLGKIKVLLKERDSINSFTEGESNQNIMPVYLKVEKLYDADTNEDYLFWKEMWKNKHIKDAENLLTPKQKDIVLKAAIKGNYDGVVFRNMQDGHKELTDIYCVFNPTQIKSATGNQGTFDPESKDITKSIKSSLLERIKHAIRGVKANPSEAEKIAGNYKKGHLNIHGLNITIENPKGSYRSGIDPDGKTWKTLLHHHYGYFLRTEGHDGDALDCFIGDNPESEYVLIINQIDPHTKKFDETKTMLGFTNEAEALEGYRINYDDKAEGRIGSTKSITMDEFKEWLKDDTTKIAKSWNIFRWLRKSEHQTGETKGHLVLMPSKTKPNIKRWQIANPEPENQKLHQQHKEEVVQHKLNHFQQTLTEDQEVFINGKQAKITGVGGALVAVEYQDGSTGTINKNQISEKQQSYKNEDESKIVNRIPLDATTDQKVEALVKLSKENQPIIDNFLNKIDKKYGTESKSSFKLPDRIKSKANRPEIKQKKSWYDVEHIRDSFRFKTVLNSLSDLPNIISDLTELGAEIVKADTEKLLRPKEWGWRIVAFDLQMPNGQLVEYYLPVKELEKAKKEKNHKLFEDWRNTTEEERISRWKEYRDAINESKENYEDAWQSYLSRTGEDDNAVRASLMKVSASLSSTGTKLSFKSSAENVPTAQTPSTRIAGKPTESDKTMTRPDSSLETTSLPDIKAPNSKLIDNSKHTKIVGQSQESQGKSKELQPIVDEVLLKLKSQPDIANIQGIGSNFTGKKKNPHDVDVVINLNKPFERSNTKELSDLIEPIKDKYHDKEGTLLNAFIKDSDGKILNSVDLWFHHYRGEKLPIEDRMREAKGYSEKWNDAPIISESRQEYKPDFQLTGDEPRQESLNFPKSKLSPIETWTQILNELQADLKQGESTNQFKNAESKNELMRKIHEAERQIEVKKKFQKSLIWTI